MNFDVAIPAMSPDLILYDARTKALTLDELKTHPTWANLPAVRAGQIAPPGTPRPRSATGASCRC